MKTTVRDNSARGFSILRNDPRRWVIRLESVSPRRFGQVALGIFVLMSLLIYWPWWPGNSHIIPGLGSDPSIQSWFIGYVPFAILHGHNPFFTTYMDYPQGVNLAANTLMPLLGVVATPITLLFGATTSFGLLIWLSYPLSAISCMWVVRKWSGSNIASLLAGYLYGFSPYIVHQGYGHLNLAFVPLPPLIFYFSFTAMVTQTANARKNGIILGLLIAAQYLISAEIALTTVTIVVCAAVAWSLVNWRRFSQQRFIYLTNVALPCVAVASVLMAFPLWNQLFGTYKVMTPPYGGIANPIRTDLWGVLYPTSLQQVAPTFARVIGDRLTVGAAVENGSYLGLPLIILFLASFVRFWRRRWIFFSGLLAIGCWILSLGPWLVVDTRSTTIRLPFYYLAQLPFFPSVLPARLSLFVIFFVGLTTALGIAEWSKNVHQGLAMSAIVSTRSWFRAIGVAVLGIAALVTLAPKLPSPTQSLNDTTPSFFTSVASNTIPDGAPILTYPYTIPTYSQLPIYWQIATSWRWRMMGAYAQIPYPYPNGNDLFPWPTPPLSVVNYLEYWEGPPSASPPMITNQLVLDVRSFIKTYSLSAVVVDLKAANEAQVVRLFTKAFGPPVIEGGVAAWLRLHH